MNPYENNDFRSDKEFYLAISSAVLASLLFLYQYKTQCHFFIKNYWLESSVIMIVLFGILSLSAYMTEIKKRKLRIGWYFYLFFFYSIPVFSFYFLPAILDLFFDSLTNKHEVIVSGTVKEKFNIKHADDPIVIFNLYEVSELKELEIPLKKFQAQELKIGEQVRIHGTISKVCFSYKFYEKLNIQ